MLDYRVGNRIVSNPTLDKIIGRDCEKAGEAAVTTLEEFWRTKPGEVATLYFRMDNPPSTEMA